MGGAALSHFINVENQKVTNEYEFFAFQVIHYDWNHGAIAADLHPEKSLDQPETPKIPSNEVIYQRVEDIVKQAYQEKETPLLECRSPAVIQYKLSKLAEAELQEFNQAIVDAAIQKDKKLHKNKKGNSTAEDYSKSFGGTAEDTKNEKEAADLMRGSSTDKSNTILEDQPGLYAPSIQHPSEYTILRKKGKWFKFLSQSGCFMFFHTLTKDLVAIKPEDYIDDDDANHNGKNQSEEKEIDESNGIPKVEFQDLPSEIERIVKEMNKTPLIIDTSANNVARTFYSYKACLEDVSCLTIPFGKSGLRKEDIMERCRKKLVSAMKTGQTFVLYLGGVTIEHADFKTKLCKKVKYRCFGVLSNV